MRPSKVRIMKYNNTGPCPNRACKHNPADHRAIASSDAYFCYGKGCMNECRPGLRKS